MKSILIFLALTLSVSAFARDEKGRIELNNGQTVIRIDVGNERDTDSRAMAQRIARLERAVRELQNRVYDLEDDARPAEREVKVVTCMMNTTFNGAFMAKGDTELEARANTINACKKGGREAFCSTNVIKCEASTQIVKN